MANPHPVIDKNLHWVAFPLFLLVLLSSCASTGKLTEPVRYDCDFDIADYLPKAPTREEAQLSGLFVWINTRLAGGLNSDPGKSFAGRLERERWQTPGEKDGKLLRKIWLIPSAMTNRNNPMNVMLERTGDRYTLTRMDDSSIHLFGLKSPGETVPTQFKRVFAGYCDSIAVVSGGKDSAISG